ncbi:unnamed protein product [Candida verbasci]|uniref:C2H2-type domain-containing protein n=1 Tax=Candida verbasci TaxID=1227364 RepID=A0A9W4TTX4_9ASCO|nr:unnamed protein product [Candida verbasci]
MLSSIAYNNMPNTNSLSKYGLHHQSNPQQQGPNSNSSVVQNQQLHSSVTLPSIHSLNIPAFPHIEEQQPTLLNNDYRSTAFKHYATTNSNNNPIRANTTATNSPTLLIPKSESLPININNINNNNNNNNSMLLSPIGSPFNNSINNTMEPNRARSYSDPYQIKQEISSLTTPPYSNNLEPLQSPTQINKKNWKPRKKRQCPECKLYFSNLATHKSTHLKPTNRPHICKYCQRGFARPNDLFRHVKCHWKEIGIDNQFRCPFKNIQQHDGARNIPIGPDHCCHNTGIFSRCDTFKNHLKAIHFQYPNGTKKDQRTKVSGKCRICQADFQNVDDWMHNHIEKNLCPYAINLIKK